MNHTAKQWTAYAGMLLGLGLLLPVLLFQVVLVSWLLDVWLPALAGLLTLLLLIQYAVAGGGSLGVLQHLTHQDPTAIPTQTGVADPAYAEAIEEARPLARAFMHAFGAPGLSVAVALDGDVVWSEAFGYVDLAQTVPVTPETPFRINSVTKPLTAAAAALLYETGRLDLDAPVQRYVPSFPDKGHPM